VAAGTAFVAGAVEALAGLLGADSCWQPMPTIPETIRATTQHIFERIFNTPVSNNG
jgi:hypothetical protein